MTECNTPADYYAAPGRMTDPGKYTYLLENLPTEISSLCQIVQNNMIHIYWLERYGVSLADEQKQTINLRKVSEKLACIQQGGTDSLIDKHDIHLRQVGNCRDFSLLLTTILRQQGIPARSRCGFGKYFLPEHFEDHWVCEYWNGDENRWIMVDSQLDSLQVELLDIHFDPLDVPSDQFISGGRAWQMCREGIVNPDQFGIFDMHGWWFIWGNVVRDFLALNKIEILPWDWGWGYLTNDLDDPLPQKSELPRYDEIAGISADANMHFHKLRLLFNQDLRFHPPDEY
jgi:hypothetical protein